MTCLLMLTLFVQVSTAPLARAGQTQPPAPSASARTYLVLLETYQHGDPNQAIDELRAWRVADAESRSIPRAMVAGQTTRTLLAIALLHTEVMLKGQSGSHSPNPPRAFALGHLQLARRAVDVLKRRAESDRSLSALYRSWLIVTTSFGLSIDIIPPPGTIPVSSDNGELLLLAGSVAEALATDPILRRDPSVSRVAMFGSSGRDSSVQLLESEQKYRAALTADVTLIEARVRLGSVLGAKGELEAARRELERARQEAPPGPLAYLAALFLGRVHERAGRFQEASDCYQAAIREYPSSQTPYLALARVLEQQGETPTAWRTVRTMLQQPEQEDPWWGYWYAQYWQIDNRVMELRAMVRQ